MKNNKSSFGFSIFGFILFFLTITFVSTITILVYYLANKTTNGNTVAIAFSVLSTICFGAIVCTIIDIFRRRMMIERPVKKILEATQKIASGDFSVRLQIDHDYLRYDEYDLIFDNINTMTAELSKNELLKNDFISNVSHEIKTPLAVIQNYSKALQSKNLTDEKKDECLNGLINQTKKLSDLISNILKLNKLENQQIVPEFKKFNLAEMIRVITLQYENLFEKKQLELECEIDEVEIENSETLLEIVFNNLLSNAIKFTDNGGKITVKVKQDKNFAFIEVKDTGCGISQEVGEHIFEKFYQGDKSHFSEGNGLGLALVKKVIDIIGGEIAVESSLGKGSNFIIKLKKGNV